MRLSGRVLPVRQRPQEVQTLLSRRVLAMPVQRIGDSVLTHHRHSSDARIHSDVRMLADDQRSTLQHLLNRTRHHLKVMQSLVRNFRTIDDLSVRELGAQITQRPLLPLAYLQPLPCSLLWPESAENDWPVRISVFTKLDARVRQPLRVLRLDHSPWMIVVNRQSHVEPNRGVPEPVAQVPPDHVTTRFDVLLDPRSASLMPDAVDHQPLCCASPIGRANDIDSASARDACHRVQHLLATRRHLLVNNDLAITTH